MSTGHHGTAERFALPEFRRGELAGIKAAELSAVVILDVGGRLDLGVTSDPRRFGRHYTSTRSSCRIAGVLWSAGPPLSRRISRLAAETLSDRRVAGSDGFDVPLGTAIGAVELAARQIGVTLRSTEQVLTELHKANERRIEALVANALGKY